MANNRVIKMHYELKDGKTGEILESNLNSDPIAFLSGKDQIIQKLEDEILNLQAGESKTVRISPGDGVGEYREDAVQILPKEQFAGIDLVVGMELFGQAEDGATTRVSVKAIGEQDVTIDFNHPFAGKELEFNIKIVENREATADEILTGQPEGADIIITRGTSAAADTDTITQRITSVAEVMGMQTVMNAAGVTITEKITNAAAGTTKNIRIFYEICFYLPRTGLPKRRHGQGVLRKLRLCARAFGWGFRLYGHRF